MRSSGAFGVLRDELRLMKKHTMRNLRAFEMFILKGGELLEVRVFEGRIYSVRALGERFIGNAIPL